jgi:hypothetical protein
VWQEKNAAANLKMWKDPEYRKKMAASNRKRWKDKDPEQRKMVLETLAKGSARKRAARQANENTLLTWVVRST